MNSSRGSLSARGIQIHTTVDLFDVARGAIWSGPSSLAVGREIRTVVYISSYRNSVFFPFILDIKFVGRTSRGHTGVCMYVCMVITYSRVWINRVRLPILLVVR